MSEILHSRRRPYAALGALIVLLFAAIIAAAVVVVRERDSGGSVLQVRVHNAFAVSHGDPVWLSGVRVGRVVSVRLSEEGTVTLTALVDPRVHVPAHTHVAVTTGLYGDRRLEIVVRAEEGPNDNPMVAYLRYQQGLEPNPLDPFIAASTGLFDRAARVQARTNPPSAAVLASAQRLRVSLARLQAQTRLLAAHGHPSFAIPALHIPSSRPSPKLRAELQQTLDEVQRMRTSLTAARGAFADPELERGFAEDQRLISAALVDLREAMPRR